MPVSIRKTEGGIRLRASYKGPGIIRWFVVTGLQVIGFGIAFGIMVVLAAVLWLQDRARRG